ncbi:MAG: site-specific DNA-methyltransferase [Melioribacter sp.]|uniref:DNA-methyltransferase n=1 Tax=Rosettibacter primus TaxID=3111523 RepID=UPI00247E9741|nr:site-specific DNA-methyltransferase [Melioribacter sp.]
MNKTKHKIIFGDSRCMKEVEDESVHLIITSPPYWQLKDYGHPDQIGFDDTYEDYINNLNLVWQECHRVLHKGCRLCINIGDQFARSVYYGRYKVIPIRTEIIRFCETIGFDYMGAIIWQKVTTSNTTGGASVMGSYPYPRNGIIKIDYEFILIFKKLGEPPKPTKEQKEKSKLTQEEWNDYFSGHWNFSGERQNGHLAMFPEELPRRLIRMFSFVGETVLDPFCGSGTTSLAAIHLQRNSIGYEINKKYKSIIEEKLKVKEHQLFEKDFSIEFIEQGPVQFNLNTLPYLFRDPIQFDKKIDPRKLTFGSKITGNEVSNNKYYYVNEVLTPNKIRLNSGQLIKLLGVKPKLKDEQKTIEFIKNITKGNPVFLKFDEIKYDDENNLLAYLFLKNKTFINAHLIKNKLVDVDTLINYKYRKKFEKLASITE